MTGRAGSVGSEQLASPRAKTLTEQSAATAKERRVEVLMVHLSIMAGRAAHAATPESHPAAAQAADERLPRVDTAATW